MLDRASRAVLGVLLAVALALVGFPLGVVLAGIYFVPPGSGLAGPTIALSYGMVAVVVTTALGAALASYLPRRSLTTVVYVALGGALVALLGIGARILQLSHGEQPSASTSPTEVVRP